MWGEIKELMVSVGNRIPKRTSDIKVPIKDLEKVPESVKSKKIPKTEEDIEKARENFHVAANTLIKAGGLTVGAITLGVTINEGIKAHNETVRSNKANEKIGNDKNDIEARKITLEEKKYADQKQREKEFRLSKAQERMIKKHEGRVHVKEGTRTWGGWWNDLWKKD